MSPGLCRLRWPRSTSHGPRPVDYAPECEVNRSSSKLPLVGAGGDRIENMGQKTVGYATRDGANVEIAFEAAKVRRSLLSGCSLVEKGQVAVFTDSGGFIIPRSALQVEHVGLDHRGARRFRAVRREPESSRWRREVILEVAGCPGTSGQLDVPPRRCFQPR